MHRFVITAGMACVLFLGSRPVVAAQAGSSSPADASGTTESNASIESSEQLVHESTHEVELELDPSTVLCSQAEYGASFLKVLIPQLASFTLLDHENLGAGAPCVAAGPCAPTGTHSPDEILDPECPTEKVKVTVQEFREETVDHDKKTCTVGLSERVAVNIRGVAFTHVRYAPLGSRDYSECVQP